MITKMEQVNGHRTCFRQRWPWTTPNLKTCNMAFTPCFQMDIFYDQLRTLSGKNVLLTVTCIVDQTTGFNNFGHILCNKRVGEEVCEDVHTKNEVIKACQRNINFFNSCG